MFYESRTRSILVLPRQRTEAKVEPYDMQRVRNVVLYRGIADAAKLNKLLGN